jgi:hypothetical protein
MRKLKQVFTKYCTCLKHMYMCGMRKSPLRHNLAKLRAVLNLSQQQMAGLTKRHWRTIQSVELRKLPLSEILARRIAAETDVQLRWLLDNDLYAPIVNYAGRPYTRRDFEHKQATKRFGDNEFARTTTGDCAAIFYSQIRAILTSATKNGLAWVATWKIEKLLEDCRYEFGPKKLFERPAAPLLKDPQVIEGIALMKKYIGEHTARMRRVEKVLKRSPEYTRSVAEGPQNRRRVPAV